jgi:hypothetical protein
MDYMQDKKTALPGVVREGHEVSNRDANYTTSDRLQEADPLLGWFGLAAGVKPSRLRQMKRGWQRKVGK